jgi:colicin import membrane protein
VVWTLRQYAIPFLLALGLHALIVAWMQGAWRGEDPTARIIKPQIVNSTLLVLEPKPKPAPPVRKPEPAPPRPEPEPVRQEPVQEKPAPEPDRTAEKAEAREAEKRLRELEAARAERLRALADSSFLNALDDESADLAEAAAADAEAVAQSYRYGIYQRIVANWSRPPSARNGMQARLQVELVPTGEVVAVMLIESSGSTVFDQSAEAAVHKADRFDVPKESAVFERYFRRFTLLFKPEDLLR